MTSDHSRRRNDNEEPHNAEGGEMRRRHDDTTQRRCRGGNEEEEGECEYDDEGQTTKPRLNTSLGVERRLCSFLFFSFLKKTTFHVPKHNPKGGIVPSLGNIYISCSTQSLSCETGPK